MKRSELRTALRAAARVARQSEFILIGSQAVHAHCHRPPAEVVRSQECDLYPRTHPQAANLLDTELGRKSAFARRHGFYVDVVTPDLATLPDGWEKRLTPFRVGASPRSAWNSTTCWRVNWPPAGLKTWSWWAPC